MTRLDSLCILSLGLGSPNLQFILVAYRDERRRELCSKTKVMDEVFIRGLGALIRTCSCVMCMCVAKRDAYKLHRYYNEQTVIFTN